MTRDEILAMPAGREMDALVAEMVMGWTYSELFGFLPPTDNGLPPPRCPEYSTYIAAAWEVVEKMKSQGWSVSVLWDNLNEAPDDTVEYLWHVDLNYYTDDAEDFRNYYAQDNSAPLAICRAALLAVL